jgi:hypothetical protein
MGYYTRFSLSTQSGLVTLNSDDQKTIDKINKLIDGEKDQTIVDTLLKKKEEIERMYDDPEDLFNQWNKEVKDEHYNPFDDSCKWYSHEEDMKLFSKRYPNTVFVLEGEGEEQGDHWICYFSNGKMQRCKAIVTFEPFDIQKLK